MCFRVFGVVQAAGAIKAASDAELRDALAGMSQEQRDKIKAAIAPPQKSMKDMVMGKWTEEQASLCVKQFYKKNVYMYIYIYIEHLL